MDRRSFIRGADSFIVELTDVFIPMLTKHLPYARFYIPPLLREQRSKRSSWRWHVSQLVQSRIMGTLEKLQGVGSGAQWGKPSVLPGWGWLEKASWRRWLCSNCLLKFNIKSKPVAEESGCVVLQSDIFYSVHRALTKPPGWLNCECRECVHDTVLFSMMSQNGESTLVLWPRSLSLRWILVPLWALVSSPENEWRRWHQ